MLRAELRLIVPSLNASRYPSSILPIPVVIRLIELPWTLAAMIVVFELILTDPLAAITPSLSSKGIPKLLVLLTEISPNPIVFTVNPPISVLTITDPYEPTVRYEPERRESELPDTEPNNDDRLN